MGGVNVDSGGKGGRRALDTEITLDPVEMAEARWVTREGYLESLRTGELITPYGISIAQRIIEHWLGRTVTDALNSEQW